MADQHLCGQHKTNTTPAPGKINTRITRTKRCCPAPGGTLAKMAVLAHGSPHAGQTGWQHLRYPRPSAMTDLLLTGRFQVRVLAREPTQLCSVSPLTCETAGREGCAMTQAAAARTKIPTTGAWRGRPRARRPRRRGGRPPTSPPSGAGRPWPGCAAANTYDRLRHPPSPPRRPGLASAPVPAGW
jgi:hypothetical protein